jgi:DNA-binding CsgD family transcriptional regulator
VSLGAFIGLLLFYSDGSNDLGLLDVDGTSWVLFIPALSAAICCSLAFAVRALLKPRFIWHKPGVWGVGLGLAGMSIMVLASILRLPLVATLAGSVLFGLGLALLGLAWGILLVQRLDTRAFLQMVLACLLAALLKIMLILLPGVWLLVGITVLMVVASLSLPTVIKEQLPAYAETDRLFESACSMISRNWVFFGGMILCLSVYSLFWSSLIMAPDSTFVIPGPLSQVGAALGACLAAMGILAFTKGNSFVRLNALSPAIPLSCIAFVLLAWFVAVWDRGPLQLLGADTGITELVSTLPIGFSVTLISILLVTRLRNEQTGLSPSFSIGLFIAFATGCFLLLIAIYATIDPSSSSIIDLMLRITYLAIAIIYLPTTLSTEKARRPKLSVPQVVQISKKYHLSKRETQVLELLVQGRGVPYIAKTAFISQNTVKSHIKNLYQKMNVHSRDELLDTVYGTGQPAVGGVF